MKKQTASDTPLTTTYWIYGLSGPDMEIRYVGKTKVSIMSRVENHISSGRRPISELQKWLSEIGTDLCAHELEIVQNPGGWRAYSWKAAERETWWIAHFLGKGGALFNKKQIPRVPKYRIITLEDAVSAIEKERAL